MYIPNPIPIGPHSMYVFRDKTKSWFKMGYSADPERRRKAACYYRYGRRSYDRIEEYYCRTYQGFFSALYLEQLAIGMLRQFGFEQVDADDWFDVDSETMDVLLEIIDELARDVIAWESDNFGLHCSATHRRTIIGERRRDTPYAKMAAKVSSHEMWRRANFEKLGPRYQPDWMRNGRDA